MAKPGADPTEPVGEHQAVPPTALGASSDDLRSLTRRLGVPLRWARWWLLVVGVVAAGLACSVDQSLTDRLIAENVRSTILWVLALPLAAGGYILLLAILASFPNGWRLCGGFLAAVLLSTAITHLLKFVVGRARPDMGLGPLVFKPFSLVGEYQSFPSGHASAAVTLALLLGIYFPKLRWIFYFSGAWVGFDRIIHNRHFTSDVLAGYVIGAVAVYICIRLLGPAFYQKELRTIKLKSRPA